MLLNYKCLSKALAEAAKIRDLKDTVSEHLRQIAAKLYEIEMSGSKIQMLKIFLESKVLKEDWNKTIVDNLFDRTEFKYLYN